MKLERMHWIGIISGAILLVVNLIFLLGKKDRNLFFFLLGISFLVVIIPFLIGLVTAGKKEEETSEMFLEFSRNLAESVTTGTPISKSIINMQNREYGALSPYVKKLANQISLGIPVHKALENFARDVGNPVISRAIALISEAERAGGEIDYILSSVAKSISEVEKLKKERKAAIYNLVVQGYIIFFIFIGIMLVMEFKILPITSEMGIIGDVGVGLPTVGAGAGEAAAGLSAKELAKPFLYLLLTQGFFAGLTIGKLAEGAVKKGIKHSFILMVTAFIVSTGARLFLG